MDGNECTSHAGAGPSANVDRPSYIYHQVELSVLADEAAAVCTAPHQWRSAAGAEVQVGAQEAQEDRQVRQQETAAVARAPFTAMIRSSEQA